MFGGGLGLVLVVTALQLGVCCKLRGYIPLSMVQGRGFGCRCLWSLKFHGALEVRHNTEFRDDALNLQKFTSIAPIIQKTVEGL